MTIEIDGSQGEGGGQVLRTSLTLSMCTGRDIVVKNIRAGRQRPGLLRQRLTALNAAREICNADVAGDEIGSQQIEFSPGEISPGSYEFKIGTAGSTTLLAQTILPALARAGNASTIAMEGGTHNGMAPSVDFIERCFVPLLAKRGLEVASQLDTHGFYPNGGGRWEIVVKPCRRLRKLELTARGEIVDQCAVVKSANIDANIAERELARIQKKLRWSDRELRDEKVTSPGPGNIVSIRLAYRNVTEIFESVGVLGVPAERVAGRAIASAKRYLTADYPVGAFLADQLIVPMVLGDGGTFLTGPLSEHTRTNIAVIEQILKRKCFEVSESKRGSLVSVAPATAEQGSY